MGKFKIFKVKDRTVVGERRRTHFSVAKVKSYVVNTGLNNEIVKKPSAFSFDAIQDALESVFKATSTAKFQLQDLSAAIPIVPQIITGPPYRSQIFTNVPGVQERVNCITVMKEYEHVSFEELRLSDYFTGRLGPKTIILDSDESDSDCCIEPEDEMELLKHRIMAEFQAVDWSKLDNLRLHSNISKEGTVYSYSGQVTTNCKSVYAFSANTVKANQVIKIQAAAPDPCPTIVAGFTSRNPASLEVPKLPNQASKLLERPDYWQFCSFDLHKSRRILMKLKPVGEVLVMFGENDYRVFTVDVSQPLWFFILASGGVRDVYFRHIDSSFNYQKPDKPLKRLTGATAGIPVTEFGDLDNDFNYRAMAEFQAVNYNNMNELRFHSNYSYGIDLCNSLGQIDINKDTPFYAFSAYTAKDDQVFKVVAKKSKPETKLHIGFTSRDPVSVDLETLPDAAGLENRPDYWIYTTFDLDKATRILVKKKTQGEVITMFGEEDWRTFRVDTTSPLWLFMHSSGGVASIHCHTIVSKFVYKKIERPRAQPTTSPTPKATQITTNTTLSPTPGPSNSRNTTPNVVQNIRNKCVICYDRPVNCALLNCRHTCLCYKCATKLKRRSENCPMCRQEISNVIQLYMS